MESINDTIIITDIQDKLKHMKNGCKDLVIITDFDFTLTHRFSPDGTNLYSTFGSIEHYSKIDNEFKNSPGALLGLKYGF